MVRNMNLITHWLLREMWEKICSKISKRLRMRTQKNFTEHLKLKMILKNSQKAICNTSVDGKRWNKTSIQWTPGSQVYLSKKKQNFGQNDFWATKKMYKSCIIKKKSGSVTFLLFAEIKLTTWGPLYTCLVLILLFTNHFWPKFILLSLR